MSAQLDRMQFSIFFPGTRAFLRRALLLTSLLPYFSTSCFAQQRPLRTADANTIPAGSMQVQAGFDFLQDVDFPLAGLSGDLTSVGVIDVRMGVGKMIELQMQGTVQHFLDVKRQVGSFVTPNLTGTSSTHDVGDLAMYAKLRIFGETKRRPALAFRFGFRMPNGDQSRGIGTNTQNIFVDLILQKHFGKMLLMGNAGIGILQAPAALFTQNDVLRYGFAFRYPVHRRVELVGEVNGYHSTRTITPSLVGTESRSQARLGLQVEAGGFYWDVAGIAGLTKVSPRTGFTFGVSKEIRLFDYGSIK
jgi:hypothetical protein